MQELRLVGIADDGEHLLLTGDGERYKLALDDALKSAVRRDRQVTRGGAAANQPDSPLRPRDVQGLIRGGVPLEEIAERAGWSLEKVQRYEGPIRAERDYISERAQAVILPSRVETITLRERASARLLDRGVEAERVVWDSWKTDDVHWTVVVRFPAGGRLREATWLFDPVNHTLRTVDDEARWLGGDELAAAGDESPEAATKSAATQRKRSAARDGKRAKVYDVEAEGGVAEAQSPHLGAALSSDDAGALTASMRARQASRNRAQRARGSSANPASVPGADSAPDMAPVEPIDVGTTPPPAPSHPRPAASDEEKPAETGRTAPVKPVKKDRGGKAAKRAQAVSEPTLDAAELPAEDESTPETAPIPTTTKRRNSRRSRSSAERTSIREAFRGHDDDDDEGLFGELPGFHEGADHGPVEVSYEDAEYENVDYDEEDFAADSDDADSVNAPRSSEAPGRDDENSEDEESEDAGAQETKAPSGSTKQAPREVPERASKNRSGRPSVPSWDDIMFGGSRGPKN